MTLVTLSSLFLMAMMASLTSSQPAVDSKPYYDIRQARYLFEDFIRKYNRVYKDAADKEVHYQAFVKTLIDINERNKIGSAIFDINQFTDYTDEELRHIMGFIPSDVYSHLRTSSSQPDLPNRPYYDIRNARHYFEKFVREYNRVYKDAADKELHYQAFIKHLIRINEENKNGSAIFDINQFADYTDEELNNIMGFLPSLV